MKLSGGRDDPVELAVQGAFRLEQLEVSLRPQKEALRHSEITCQPQIQLGVHRSNANDNSPQLLSIGANRCHQLHDIEAQRLHDLDTVGTQAAYMAGR